jgi:hypothetical protein
LDPLLAFFALFIPCFQAELSMSEPIAVKAWFTDAIIDDSWQGLKPDDALADVHGTAGKGVLLDRSIPVENSLFSQQNGIISFWLKPNWNGNDGKRHVILRIGDPEKNGLLVEKAANDMLRYVMASPVKMTAARSDVSYWKVGKWHHIAISWITANDRPIGIPLWIDKVCMDGPIFGGSEFANPEDNRVWIGDSTSDAVMDELICRNKFDSESSWGQVAEVYRDYFRTAPYTKIEIDLHPHYGPMEPRVVQGCQKQFGLLAKRHGKMEKVTDFAVRYAQWADFDAKPFIKWYTSDEKIATVDENGMVTGNEIGKCTLTAEYREMKASYQLEVIPIEQPDLDLVYVERLPKYANDADKDRPAPGDRVQSVAHIINFGYQTAPMGAEVIFQLIPDANRNFRLDEDEKPTETQQKIIDRELNPGEEITVAFDWTWTNEPTWVRVVVDPKGKFSEICNANNERCELNIARPLQMGITRKMMDDFYNNRKINHIGSFSLYDWMNGQLARFEAMFRDAVYPTTSPDGVRESFRIDKTYIFDPDETKWEDEPYAKDEKFYDGGFPVNEPINLMAVDSAILHEFGHTCASLPDLYGYPMSKDNVFLKDENGNYYAGGDLLPCVYENSNTLPMPSSIGVPCAVSYSSIMDFCHLWLPPWDAGMVQWFAGYRGGRFWGTQGRMIAMYEHILKVYDINDEPLKDAAIYVYHVINTPCQDAAGTKYFADRPKFIGNTDEDGRFRFPNQTDESWDDPDTDIVEGAYTVWNPFGRASTLTGSYPDVAFTPNVWIVEGLLLLKIVNGNQTEFQWLPLTEFNRVFFEGNKHRGTYPIRTSLQPTDDVTKIVKPEIPDAIKEKNLKPVAIAPEEVTVKCGEEFIIDGTKSYDPEGQPLIYRWHRRQGEATPDFSTESVLKGKAPNDPGESVYQFYVIDGLRASDPVDVRIRIERR